jgi:hypothetical protein
MAMKSALEIPEQERASITPLPMESVPGRAAPSLAVAAGEFLSDREVIRLFTSGRRLARWRLIAHRLGRAPR